MYEVRKVTRKRNGNFNIYIKDYIDEKIEVHLDILYKYSIKTKKIIYEEEFNELIKENENKLAKQKSLKILSYSPKTKKEIVIKLRQNHFSKNSIEYAIEFLDKYKFIDEYNIAYNLVNGSYKRKKYSKRMIISRLRQKGISSQVVDSLVCEIDDKEEYENALYYANKKIRTLRDEDKYIIKRKVFNFLSYRGYDYSVISAVLENLIGN